MGNGLSSTSSVQIKEFNQTIEKQIKADLIVQRKTVKILLIGSSGCGKSTILKQLKLHHIGGFSSQERQQYKIVVRANVLDAMRSILEAMSVLGISFAKAENKALGERFLCLIQQIGGQHIDNFAVELLFFAAQLWKDEGVRQCYERSNEYQLDDSAGYFLDATERIAETMYEPTELDLVRVRAPTTGIVELVFQRNVFTVRVIDVGGQRSERKKWMHCFDSVSALLFVTALSEYNQTLREDGITNRMLESITVFKSMLNCSYFVQTNFLLFLNKKDIFETKITQAPISTVFPQFSGPNTFGVSLQFIKSMFLALNQLKERVIYTHITCATDSDQVRFVLDSALDLALNNNLAKAGVL